jgi:hypothetical protein
VENRGNPSALATVNCKFCKSTIALYCLDISGIKSACVTNCNKSNYPTYSVIICDAYHPTRYNIYSAWETIRQNIKISAKESLGYYELKKHKSWFSEGCSKLLDHRKQAKLQWLQDPSEINVDNLNNI